MTNFSCSHELQTCDWPRNVGCGDGSASDGNGGGIVATVSTVRVTDPRARQSTNSRTSAPVQREREREQRPLQRETIPKVCNNVIDFFLTLSLCPMVGFAVHLPAEHCNKMVHLVCFV